MENLKKGKVSVVGTGPGSLEYLTDQARAAIEKSDLIVGYRLYVEQISELIEDREVVSSAMGKEVERCRLAVDEAAKGKQVALVSGGDPGVYGMAGVLLQVAREAEDSPEVEIIPGLTAASAAAAELGAPLMHDFAVISLSDLLTPWDLIEKRIMAAAEADFVIVLYNPRSRGRSDLLSKARELILEKRKGKTPVGIVKSAGREDQEKFETTLEAMVCRLEEVDMASLVIIGNSSTYWQAGKMITPRGYAL